MKFFRPKLSTLVKLEPVDLSQISVGNSTRWYKAFILQDFRLKSFKNNISHTFYRRTKDWWHFCGLTPQPFRDLGTFVTKWQKMNR